MCLLVRTRSFAITLHALFWRDQPPVPDTPTQAHNLPFDSPWQTFWCPGSVSFPVSPCALFLYPVLAELSVDSSDVGEVLLLASSSYRKGNSSPINMLVAIPAIHLCITYHFMGIKRVKQDKKMEKSNEKVVNAKWLQHCMLFYVHHLLFIALIHIQHI